MLEQIHWLLDHFPFINNLCEIGTGHGLMLDYLSGQLTQIERFHGIDLSAEQISRNQAIYAGSKVEFLPVEAADYVVQHCRPGTLFVACGAFECFTQAELEEFASSLKTVTGSPSRAATPLTSTTTRRSSSIPGPGETCSTITITATCWRNMVTRSVLNVERKAILRSFLHPGSRFPLRRHQTSYANISLNDAQEDTTSRANRSASSPWGKRRYATELAVIEPL